MIDVSTYWDECGNYVVMKHNGKTVIHKEVFGEFYINNDRVATFWKMALEQAYRLGVEDTLRPLIVGSITESHTQLINGPPLGELTVECGVIHHNKDEIPNV